MSKIQISKFCGFLYLSCIKFLSFLNSKHTVFFIKNIKEEDLFPLNKKKKAKFSRQFFRFIMQEKIQLLESILAHNF